MRTLSFIAICFSLFVLASCSTTYDASAPYDEVYASASSGSKAPSESVTVRSKTVESTSNVEGDYYNPQYQQGEFDSSGYYDYEYSSRIKRFQDQNPGFDYYGNYYTDNYYYNGDPNYMGSDIYSGCGCCSGPSFSIGFGLGYAGFGWGYPYYGYGYPYYGYYDPWYYPYYGWGYGYPGSYWAGYNDGYWDGYYWGSGGYYPPYSDPYPGGGNYYGPRGNRSGSSNGTSSTGLTRDDRGNDNTVQSFDAGARGTRTDAPAATITGNSLPGSTPTGTKESALNSARGFRSESTTTSPIPAGNNATVTPKTEVIAPGAGQPVSKPTYNKPPETVKTDRPTGQAVKSGDNTILSPSRRVAPEMKYEKPKAYTAPSYRTTPSNQEYSSPSMRDSRTYSDQNEGATRKVYTTTPERRSVDSQSRSMQEGGSTKMNSLGNSSQHRYASPSRSAERSTYSSPSSSGSRSYSAPSRSYSSPSVNSGSSSGGSHSSGGSFGGSSGGGGGSRGGRR